jgi:sialidase-1
MEPGLIQKSDGSLLQIIRTQTGKQWFAESPDDGDTWSAAQPWTIVSPEAPATLAPIPGEQQWLIVYNPILDPSHSHGGRRTPLVAAITSDEGATWSAPQVIESNLEQTYSYPSIDFHQGRVLLTYYVEDQQQRISWKFKSLPLQQLLASAQSTQGDGR